LERGVDVELITSAKRDQPVYKYIKNGLLLRRLIKKGLKVYESHEKILHTKAYIFDKNVMSIGSFNNDRWSWKINNETNISIHSAEEFKKAEHYFEDLKDRCQPVDLSPEVGFARKIKMIFWERFLYLSEVVMSKTKLFDFKSFLYKSPMSAPDDDDV
jgi:phosphatidylserine/phosphatidylglycerophosphate/cardiolipin synthase-like enzyme